MDIKSLLEEFDKINPVILDDMEDETGVNEVVEETEAKNESVNEAKDLAEKPADMEQAEYDEIKPVKPEIDGNTVAKKLLKQCEELNEVAPETAKFVNDKRNFDAIKAQVKAEQNPEDEEAQQEAKEANTKAEKSNELYKKWKQSKGIEESKKVGE